MSRWNYGSRWQAGALGVFSKTGFHCVSPVHITEHLVPLAPAH